LALLLDGKKASTALRELLRPRVESLRARLGRPPVLVMVRVGEDPASIVYMRSKEKAAAKVGIESRTEALPESTTQETLRHRIEELNADASVEGIIVQLPLPPHLDEDAAIEAIDPRKDVDGFHPLNLGLLCAGRPRFVPATPRGILRLLEHYGVDLTGRRVVVVGRSRIVGRPLANLLSMRRDGLDATVTIAHSRTKDLRSVTREAEVLIVAAGRKRMIDGSMVADGAVVVDVGIHREEDPERPGKSRLCGDVDFISVEPKASAISPVPGGVGPMTVACLLENTVEAAEALRGEALL